jgi:phage terminase large subunit-like protein
MVDLAAGDTTVGSRPIKEIVFHYDREPHDLYFEGIEVL